MNIVICCDGTRGKYGVGEKNTNIVRLFERLGQDGPEQVSYYDPGVGTYSTFRGGFMGMLDKLAASVSGDGLTSEGLDQNIEEAYRYLMNSYVPDSRVYLFGYSRGAHTVRVLAAMLNKCGLLTKGSDNLIPAMTDIYHRGSDRVAKGFRASFSRTCKPHFIGVWDTVASVGWLRRRQFSNNLLNHDVNYAYQALAIDERRRHFRASVWGEDNLPSHQTIEQVWFAGSHGDVGGQNADRAISDISLEWMLENAEKQGLKLREDWQSTLCSNHAGKIRRADRHIWKIGAADRFIPDGAKVDQTALDRRNDLSLNYQPRNLPRTGITATNRRTTSDDKDDKNASDPPPNGFVEQYKLMAQSADNASSRRVNINAYQVTINLGILALYGLDGTLQTQKWFLPIVALAGIAVSVNWLMTIRSLGQLNSAKFNVILGMEKRMPEEIFADEWEELKEGKSMTYKGAGFFEKLIPPVFTLIHSGVLGFALYALLTNSAVAQ